MKELKKNCMRLDRFLASQAGMSRKDAASSIRHGSVLVDGKMAKQADMKIVPGAQTVLLNGAAVSYHKFIYIMMNKPAGVLSASRDREAKTVLDLLPDACIRPGLFPAGRLDKDTTGLLIITDNGGYAHKMLSPKKHVYKRYKALLRETVTEENLLRLRGGIAWGTEQYAPARVRMENDHTAIIDIHEGRFHQVKRMFEACGNEVVSLARTRIGGLLLDPMLTPGEARMLAQEEALLVFEDIAAQ